jgi:hypothetical protein
MTDHNDVLQVVKDTSRIMVFLQDAGVGVGTFLLGAGPILIWWLKKKEKKQAQKEAIEISDLAKQPKYVEVTKFDEFDKKNAEAHEAVKGKLTEAIKEFGDTRKEVGDLRAEVGEVRGGVNTIISLLQK